MENLEDFMHRASVVLWKMIFTNTEANKRVEFQYTQKKPWFQEFSDLKPAWQT